MNGVPNAIGDRKRSGWMVPLLVGFILGAGSAFLFFRLMVGMADTATRQLAQDIQGIGGRLESAIRGAELAPAGSSVRREGRDVGTVLASVEYRPRELSQQFTLYVADYGANEPLVRNWSATELVGLLTETNPIRIEVTTTASLGTVEQIGELTVAGAAPIPVVRRSASAASGSS